MKKILIIFSVFLFIFAFAATVSAAAPDDLVGWWRLENNVNDSTINGNNGVAMGGATYDVGQTGQALKLDGIDDYVNLGNGSGDFDFTNKFTVEAWIKGDSFQSGYYDLMIFRGYNNWAFGVDRSKRLMFGEAGWTGYFSRQIYSDTLSWTTGQWYHIAVVYDTVGKTADFYRDDAPIGVGKQSIDKLGIINSGNITIGYSNPTGFNGLIDNVRIWKTALSVGELGMSDVDLALLVDTDDDDDGVLDTVDNCPINANPDQADLDVDGIGDVCEPDDDSDGVIDDNDICDTTVDDGLYVELGVNRHIWEGNNYFTTLVPTGKKGEKATTSSQFTLTETKGCSCEQILGILEEKTGLDFDGHEKYGCSKSVIEDWIANKYYTGPTVIETVEVPANASAGVLSSVILESDKGYSLKAYGTATACWQTGCTITFDAEYSTSDGINPWVTYADGVAAPYDTYGLDLLDLKVDGSFVDWGAYNSEHTYQIPYAGTGNLLLITNDLPGSYFNNSGSLFVDIIEEWVNLW